MVKNGDFKIFTKTLTTARLGRGLSCDGVGLRGALVHDVVKKLSFAMDIHCEIGRVVIYSLLLLCL